MEAGADGMNLYQKLSHIQSNLKAPKSQYNKFGNYNYRNCEDILEALKPLLEEVGAALIIGDELIQVGDRYYIKATARLIDTGNGEAVENTAYAREEAEKKGMDASQVTGSTGSYARKYALNGLFCIDDTKDADAIQEKQKDESGSKKGQGNSKGKHSNGPENGKNAMSEPQFINEEQLKALSAEINRTGVSEGTLLKAAHVDDFHKLTPSLYEGLMKRLKATADKEQKK